METEIRCWLIICACLAVGVSPPAVDLAAAQESESAEAESSDADDATEESGASAEETPPEDLLQLKTLVERARTNKDLLDEFEARRDQAEWKRYQAKWAWGPKIESMTRIAPVPANADPSRVQQNFDEIANLNIGPFISENLEVAVPVYTFGRIKNLRKLADVGIDVAALKKREAQLNAIFQTKRAFYSLQLSRTFEELLEEGDERIEKRLQEMEDARDFGEAEFETEDLRKLQIFSAEVDSRISDNEKLASISTSGLKYLTDTTGERLAVGKLDEESEPAELKDLQTYVSAAMERRPEIQQLEEAIKARELQVSLEKSNFLPNLFVAANFGVAWSTEETAKQPVCERASENAECINVPNRFARPDNDPLNRLSIGIGAGIRWNLDPLNQVGKLNERRAQLRQIKAQYRRAVGAIRLDIKKKWKDASEALKKIGINDRRLEAARRWRDQLGFSIETAGAEISDAIDPLKAFYEAKAKYLEARYNYLIARAALAQGVGAAKLGDVEAGNRVDGTGSLEAAGAEPGE